MVTLLAMSTALGLRAPVLAAPKIVAQVPLLVETGQLAPAITVPATLVIVTVPVWKVLLPWVVVALKVAKVPWWKTDPRPPRMTRPTSAFWNSLPARPAERAGSEVGLAVADVATRGSDRTFCALIRKAATG